MIKGHSRDDCKYVCGALGIPLLSGQDFCQMISGAKEETFTKKVVATGPQHASLFPCLVYFDQHICVATHDNQAKKYLFSYVQLAAAF